MCVCEYVTVCFPLRNWHVKTVQMICRGHGFENLCLCEKFLFFFLFPCRPPRPDVTTTTTTMARHYYCDGRELLNFKFSWIFLCVRCALLWVCECVSVSVRVRVCASVNSMSEALLVVRLEITNEHSVGLQYIKVTQELA